MEHQNDHLTQIICFLSLFLPPHPVRGRENKGILEDGIYQAIVSGAIVTFHHRATPPAFPITLNFQDVLESAQGKLAQMDAWLQIFPAPLKELWKI